MLSLGLQEHFYDLFGTLYSRSNLITFQKHFLSFFSWNWILLILMYPSSMRLFGVIFKLYALHIRGPYHDKNRSRQTVLLPKFLEPEIGWTLAFLKWLASCAATWRGDLKLGWIEYAVLTITCRERERSSKALHKQTFFDAVFLTNQLSNLLSLRTPQHVRIIERRKGTHFYCLPFKFLCCWSSRG